MINHSSTPLTVSQLTQTLKNLLESRFSEVSIQGEITNFKPNASGHLYFDLKDAGAKIAVVMFRTHAASLSRLPKEGDSVTVKGSIAIYAPHGRYQVVIQQMNYLGVGELLLKLEELKRRLKTLGWFEKEKKKPLPAFPKRIGVVTSPTGAVIRDIINILSRRLPGFHLILNPVRVQGAEAATEIAKAIREFNQYNLADVLIVGRGGGSLEDLWPFNEEIVAAAIHESRIPIISAVGHETDFTIADFVADVRAPTPSAAAELVSETTFHHYNTLQKMRTACQNAALHLLRHTKERLKRYSTHPLLTQPYAFLGTLMQKLDDLDKETTVVWTRALSEKKRLLISKRQQLDALKPTTQMRLFKQKLDVFENRLRENTLMNLRMRGEKVRQIKASLGALDPKNVLNRGYSILFARKDHSVIVSAKDFVAGDEIEALLIDGKAILKVIENE